jgi:hypothetical protein
MAKKSNSNPSGVNKRILRIGVILGGKIIEERLLRNRQTITVGQSQKTPLVYQSRAFHLSGHSFF